MAKNTIEIKLEAKDINVTEVIEKIHKQFDKIGTTFNKTMKTFSQRGSFNRGLKQLKDDIEAGTKPASELQSQFDVDKAIQEVSQVISEFRATNFGVDQRDISKLKTELSILRQVVGSKNANNAESSNNNEITEREM